MTSWETEIHVHSLAAFGREDRSSLIGFMSRVDGIANLTPNVITVAGAVGSSLVLP